MTFLEALREYVRPLAVAAMVGTLILGACVAGAMEAIKPGLGVAFTGGVAGWFRAVPDSFYQAMTALALGYMAAREVGKWKTAPPKGSRVDPEEVDA